MNPYLKQYQKSQIETATPEKILIMLYDGAIQFLNIARNEMASEEQPLNIQKIHNNIVSAQKIITEFKCTLNLEIGGEMAQNLYDLYTYLYNRLVEANVKKNVSAIDEVLGHLKDLRNTWQQAIEISSKELKNKSLVSYGNSDDDEDIEDDEDLDDSDYYEKAGKD